MHCVLVGPRRYRDLAALGTPDNPTRTQCMHHPGRIAMVIAMAKNPFQQINYGTGKRVSDENLTHPLVDTPLERR